MCFLLPGFYVSPFFCLFSRIQCCQMGYSACSCHMPSDVHAKCKSVCQVHANSQEFLSCSC